MVTHAKPSDATLTVDFAGDVRTLSPADDLTFGRGSKNDLPIDSNPLLHRSFGHIFYRDAQWWIRNNGKRITISINDLDSQSNVTLTASRESALTFPRARIAFAAGPSTYELLIDLTLPVAGATSDDDDEFDLSMTMDQSQVPLVGDQRLLAVALAESKLRAPHAPIDLPANKAVAHRFGWSMTTFNRKLDRLCKKFAKAGVSGLVGRPGEVASDRRRVLVDHLVSTGILTTADLDLIEDPA